MCIHFFGTLGIHQVPHKYCCLTSNTNLNIKTHFRLYELNFTLLCILAFFFLPLSDISRYTNKDLTFSMSCPHASLSAQVFKIRYFKWSWSIPCVRKALPSIPWWAFCRCSAVRWIQTFYSCSTCLQTPSSYTLHMLFTGGARLHVYGIADLDAGGKPKGP